MSQDKAKKREYDKLNRQRANELYRLRKRQRRTEYLSDKACAVCGGVERLEIDHVDPSTKISHDIWGWGESKRAQELSKCQVLCRDCHIVKTVINRDNVHQGEAHFRTILTWEQVQEIRTISGKLHREIAAIYGISRPTVSRIRRGDGWRAAS